MAPTPEERQEWRREAFMWADHGGLGSCCVNMGTDSCNCRPVGWQAQRILALLDALDVSERERDEARAAWEAAEANIRDVGLARFDRDEANKDRLDLARQLTAATARAEAAEAEVQRLREELGR